MGGIASGLKEGWRKKVPFYSEELSLNMGVSLPDNAHLKRVGALVNLGVLIPRVCTGWGFLLR
jgi:hypothetical protein